MASSASPSTAPASSALTVKPGKPRVVIIGCGFGGLEAAKAYADALAQQAMQALADTGLPESRLAALRALTAMVVERNN